MEIANRYRLQELTLIGTMTSACIALASICEKFPEISGIDDVLQKLVREIEKRKYRFRENDMKGWPEVKPYMEAFFRC